MDESKKMPCTAGCREETAGFVEDDPLCTTLDNLCEALDSWRETMKNPWQREDRAYRKELAENIQALVRLMLMDAAELEARYKEPYPKDCMEQDRGERWFQTFNPD